MQNITKLHQNANQQVNAKTIYQQISDIQRIKLESVQLLVEAIALACRLNRFNLNECVSSENESEYECGKSTETRSIQ